MIGAYPVVSSVSELSVGARVHDRIHSWAFGTVVGLGDDDVRVAIYDPFTNRETTRTYRRDQVSYLRHGWRDSFYPSDRSDARERIVQI